MARPRLGMFVAPGAVICILVLTALVASAPGRDKATKLTPPPCANQVACDAANKAAYAKAAEMQAEANRIEALGPTAGATAKMTYWGTNYGVSLVGMKITAPKTRGVKDFRLKCIYAGATSDTIIATDYATIYESVPAGKTRTFNAVRVGFAPSGAQRGGCELIGATAF
jgi:hypothetical protein